MKDSEGEYEIINLLVRSFHFDTLWLQVHFPCEAFLAVCTDQEFRSHASFHSISIRIPSIHPVLVLRY